VCIYMYVCVCLCVCVYRIVKDLIRKLGKSLVEKGMCMCACMGMYACM